MKRITQKDIADKLNISRTTVGRVLNNSGPVDEKTREKVLKVAKELGYKINPIAKSLAMKESMYIYAFIIKSYNNEFFQEISKGLQAAYKDFSDYNVKLQIVELDVDKPGSEIRQIEKVLCNEKVDGIILMPTMIKKDKTIIEKCMKKRIPVITLDMDVKNSKRKFHIGPDYYKLGRIAAELLANFIGQSGKILLISSSSNYASVNERFNGFADKIKQYKDIEIIGPVFDNYVLDNIYDITKEKVNEDVKAVYSTLGTEYVVDALKDLKLEGKIKVVANDLSAIIKQYLKEGYVQAIVYQRPFLQGYVAGKTMFDYLFKKIKPDKETIDIGCDIIMKENLDIYWKVFDKF